MTQKPSENFNPNPTFNFDFENRLIGHKTSVGNIYAYTYDGLGNRLQKYFSTSISRYVTDVSGDLSRTLAIASGYGSGGIIEKFTYGLGLLSDNGSSYYLEDGLGNIRFTANSSGSKTSRTDYDPYGNYRSGGKAPFQFQGQWQDSESNLYYLRARYYDPSTGRFISKDPVKGYLHDPRTQNGYDYALNNPINLSDPSGEDIYGGCASGSVGLAVYGTCSVYILYSTDEKAIGVSGSFGWGGTTGLNLGVSPQGLYSNAKSFSEFSGQDVTVGGSGGEVITAGGDKSWGIDDPNVVTYTGGPGIGIKLSLPLLPYEAHGGTNYTGVLPVLQF